MSDEGGEMDKTATEVELEQQLEVYRTFRHHTEPLIWQIELAMRYGKLDTDLVAAFEAYRAAAAKAGA